jgi:spore coat protein U-like protein
MTAIAFGNIDVTTGAPVDSTGTLTVTCTGGLLPLSSQLVCINIGAGSNGDVTSRRMSGPSFLRYELYSDAARTIPWGSWQTGYDSAGVSVTIPQNGTRSLTVYGRVLGSQQSAASGFYSDTLAGQPFVTWEYTPLLNTCPDSLDGTTSTSFTVTATVTPSCTVSTAGANFGTVGVLTSAIDTTGTVNVTCSSGAPYNVGIGAGNGTGATVSARKMSNGANAVTYSLYSNAGRTAVWGNTIGTDTLTGIGIGTSQALTVYGRVPAQAAPPPGTYTDSAVVTVTY